jgi:hypothetical protein
VKERERERRRGPPKAMLFPFDGSRALEEREGERKREKSEARWRGGGTKDIEKHSLRESLKSSVPPTQRAAALPTGTLLSLFSLSLSFLFCWIKWRGVLILNYWKREKENVFSPSLSFSSSLSPLSPLSPLLLLLLSSPLHPLL